MNYLTSKIAKKILDAQSNEIFLNLDLNKTDKKERITIDRDRGIAKLHKKLQNGSAVKKSKYLKVNNSSIDNNNCNLSYEIDFAKIEEDKKYDGFYAIASSDTSSRTSSLV